MRSLYISHIGMTEPLGQSQVLPYLVGVARRGAKIRILSFEASTVEPGAIDALRQRLGAEGIDYQPMTRSPAHDLATKARESGGAVLRGLAAALTMRPDIVHARSYLPAAAADVIASLAPRAKLLFDCRGMLGDEYVDNGQWTTSRLEYRLLKRFERRVFKRAQGVIVLTRALRGWLDEQAMLGAHTRVEVVPCCVDLDRFSPDQASRTEARAELGVGDRLVLLYSGSLSSWYLEDEMARFAAEVRAAAKERGLDVALVVLSPSPSEPFRAKLAARGFAGADVIVRKVAPARMAHFLRAGDIGMSFIQSCFSKKGSSPTKVAEYLASGLVVALNGDIGDQRDLAPETQACAVLGDYSDAELAGAAHRVVTLALAPYEQRSAETLRVARRHFSLSDVGVPRYERLYRALAAGTSRLAAENASTTMRASRAPSSPP